MKVRIKFSKQGEMRFIGHLDLQRFFQKVIRRAGIAIKFSEGFSPHMVMSFASPLGVGLTSEGEYIDIELVSSISTREALLRMNEGMPEGLRVLDFRQIEEGKAAKAMSIVAAADYEIRFREGYEPEPDADWKGGISDFLARTSIPVEKESKKAAKKGRRRGGEDRMIQDIRPLIYRMELSEDARGPKVFLRCASGSSANLKPELVMKTYLEGRGIAPAPFALTIHRLDLFARTESGDLISLNELGTKI